MIAQLLPLLLAVQNASGCWPVTGERVLARDLLTADPLFAAADPDLPIGFTPLPGTRRVFSGREIVALAKRFGLPLVPNAVVPNVCVERATTSLPAAELKAALETALAIDGAQIELVDFSRQPLPRGRLEFKPIELNVPPAGNTEAPVLWRGRLLYDGQHTIAIWAKVRISVERIMIVATQGLRPGLAIQPDQIQVVRRHEFPRAAEIVDAPEKVIGKMLSRSIRTGQPIPLAALQEPAEIVKGDKVQVRVMNGSARVSFEAAAISGGRVGDAISLRNPANGRAFRAVVEGKGNAVVRAGGSV